MSQKLILPIDACAFSAGYKNAAYKAQQGYTHYGVDLYSTSGNTIVKACGDGIVKAAGMDGATAYDKLGNCCVIVYRDVELPSGEVKDLACRMFHFASLNVREGQMVKKGEIIGHYGNTGSTLVNGKRMGAHLHIEFDTDVEYPAFAMGIKSSGKVIKKGTVDSTVNPSTVWYLGTGQTIRGIYAGWFDARDISLPKEENAAETNSAPIAWDEKTYNAYWGNPVWMRKGEDAVYLYDKWYRKVPSASSPNSGDYISEALKKELLPYDGKEKYEKANDPDGRAGVSNGTIDERKDIFEGYTDAQLGAALRKFFLQEVK